MMVKQMIIGCKKTKIVKSLEFLTKCVNKLIMQHCLVGVQVKISVRQIADICLFSTAQYKCPVAELESEERMPVGPSQTLTKVYTVTPLLSENKDKRGLALDGKLKHEDTNLASSTMLEVTSKLFLQIAQE